MAGLVAVPTCTGASIKDMVVTPAMAGLALPAVRSMLPTFVNQTYTLRYIFSANHKQLPFNVGWQDLKDLFRQAGKWHSSDKVKCHPMILEADMCLSP